MQWPRLADRGYYAESMVKTKEPTHDWQCIAMKYIEMLKDQSMHIHEPEMAISY